MATTIQVHRMVTETYTIPEGYIRFSDALQKYRLKAARLSMWIARGHVHADRAGMERWHFVREQHIREKLGLD